MFSKSHLKRNAISVFHLMDLVNWNASINQTVLKNTLEAAIVLQNGCLPEWLNRFIKRIEES